MNSEPHNPQLPENDIEVRIVAWIMGELAADDAAELEALVAADPQLQAFKQAVEQTAGLVGETLSQAEKTDSEAVPPKLDPARKLSIQTQWAQATPTAAEDNEPALFFIALVWLQRYGLQATAVMVVVIGLFLALSIPALQKVRSVSVEQAKAIEQQQQDIAKDWEEIPALEKQDQSSALRLQPQASEATFRGVAQASPPPPSPRPVIAMDSDEGLNGRQLFALRDEVSEMDRPSEIKARRNLPRSLAIAKNESANESEPGGDFTLPADGGRSQSRLDEVRSEPTLSEPDAYIPIPRTKQRMRQGLKTVPDSDTLSAADSESPPAFSPQPEREASQDPYSTFSLNVSDVSYQLAVAALTNDELPRAQDIRSEEFLNAFDYRDPAPRQGEAFAFNWERAISPFAHNRDVLRFSLQTAASGRADGQPLNITLLLDHSGSMERADRKAIVTESLRTLSHQFKAHDTVNIITFARTATMRVSGLPGNRLQEQLEHISNLTPEGGTNLEAALALAYQVAQQHFNPKANNRVILMTDGAANLGNINPPALKAMVERQRELGIALDAYGVGWVDYNDTLLETITRNSDGNYAFLNSPEDAQQDFAEELAGALHVAAAEVKVQVVFNPDRVHVYRQHGYYRHQLTAEQFRDNTVDAAELTQAESGNALYSVQLKPDGLGAIGKVYVRYRSPSDNRYHEQTWEIPYQPHVPRLSDASPSMRLAAAATFFAEYLARNPYAQSIELKELAALTQDLPDHFNNQEQVKQLLAMIRAAR